MSYRYTVYIEYINNIKLNMKLLIH